MSASDHRRLSYNKAWTYGHVTKRRFGSLVTAERSRQRLIEKSQGLEGMLIIYSCMWGDEFNENGPSGIRHYHVAHRNRHFMNSAFDTSVPEDMIAEAMKRSKTRKGSRPWE
jgi:hypothetical protein